MIESPPTTVTAGVAFALSGKFVDKKYSGKKISITVDGIQLPSPIVDAQGNYTLNTVLNQPGDRQIRITLDLGNSTFFQQSFPIKVEPVEGSKPAIPPVIPPGSLTLSGSVGQGGANKESDVLTVQLRLKALGFNLDVDGAIGDQTIGRIKLFQSIISGASRINGDGRVDANGFTHKWLQASNAPGWQRMPSHDPSIGFFNQELVETWDDHDYGTTWLADAILWIAQRYQSDYRAKKSNASPFTINDVSRPHGGPTPDHSGHETGLMCDVFLPKMDGGAGLPTYNTPQYDRNACRAMLVSIRKHPLFRLAYFNDPQLIKEGLCSPANGHHNHIHFEIKPPPRKD